MNGAETVSAMKSILKFNLNWFGPHLKVALDSLKIEYIWRSLIRNWRFIRELISYINFKAQYSLDSIQTFSQYPAGHQLSLCVFSFNTIVIYQENDCWKQVYLPHSWHHYQYFQIIWIFILQDIAAQPKTQIKSEIQLLDDVYDFLR
jgi:hypothetical protein